MKHHTYSKEDRLTEMAKWRENEQKIKARLEYLRGEINAERISYSEIAELQSLAKHIEKDDVTLLEWAGVTEQAEPVAITLNVVNCGHCGGIFGHTLKVEELWCPYCGINEDISSFPDVFVNSTFTVNRNN